MLRSELLELIHQHDLMLHRRRKETSLYAKQDYAAHTNADLVDVLEKTANELNELDKIVTTPPEATIEDPALLHRIQQSLDKRVTHLRIRDRVSRY